MRGAEARAALRVRVERDGQLLTEGSSGCSRAGGPTFGRDPRCTFVLPLETLSSTHFVVRLAGPGRLSVKDYSAIGTRVDGAFVHQREVETPFSTTIEIGPFKIRIEAEALAPPPPPPPPRRPRAWEQQRALGPIASVVADRFELEEGHPRNTRRGRDRVTGELVSVLASPNSGPLQQLELPALRDAHRRPDRRIARLLHDEPLVVEAGEAVAVPESAVARAGLALLELAAELAPSGLLPLYALAWIPRDGSSEVRAPLTSIDYGLSALANWLDLYGLSPPPDHKPRALGSFLAEHSDDPRSAERAARLPDSLRPRSVPVDVDAAITRLEASLADVLSRPRASHEVRNTYAWPLAAALHHRACITAASGTADDARRALPDVTRATEIDGMPQYWTTRALLEERAGLPCSDTHERAVTAVAPWRRAAAGPPPPSTLTPRLVARTLASRGVFRARSGDPKGALADLIEADAIESTELTRAWLSRLRRGV